MSTPTSTSISSFKRTSSIRQSLTSSTSLSHAINSIDTSKPAVVIEIGTRFTRCGFAGEYVPRAIIHTSLVLDSPATSTPTKNESIEDVTVSCALAEFFREIFYSYLLTMPRERRVVIVESVLMPTSYRHAIAKVLFDILDVPSVLFLPSHLCVAFPFNSDNALVVDIGYQETVALPVAEGVLMLNNWEISSVGSRRLETRVLDLLLKYAKVRQMNGDIISISDDDVADIKKSDIVEEVISRYLICTSRERGLQFQQCEGPPSEVKFAKDLSIPLGNRLLVVPGFIREAACEVLFEDANEDDPSLPHVIIKSLTRLPLDLRKRLAEGMAIVGGTALIPGLLARLKHELLHRLQSDEMRSKMIITQIKFFFFAGQNFELYGSWVGGSLFAANTDAMQLRSISKEYWTEKSSLPDWTDFVDYNIPNGSRPDSRTNA